MYAGNDGLFDLSSGALPGDQLVVVPTTCSVTLSTSIAGAVYGEAVTLTASVNPMALGVPDPSGTGASKTARQSWDLHSELRDTRFTVSSLALGPHSIQAFFGSNGDYTGSQSPAIGLLVDRDGPVINVVPSANPSPPNCPLTLRVGVIAAAPGSGMPTGTVTFYNGKKELGAVTLDDGVADLVTKKLTKGGHTITVVYGGSPDFSGAIATLREVVKQPVHARGPHASCRRTDPCRENTCRPPAR